MGTELERPEIFREYTINGETWVVMEVQYYAEPGHRAINMQLEPLEQVEGRRYR
jgi:hypothetical protein